jgi:hypothetical protein
MYVNNVVDMWIICTRRLGDNEVSLSERHLNLDMGVCPIVRVLTAVCRTITEGNLVQCRLSFQTKTSVKRFPDRAKKTLGRFRKNGMSLMRTVDSAEVNRTNG